MHVKSAVFGLLAASIALTSCQDYYFETIRLETIKEQSVVVPAAKPIPADILFIVDNSCSMEDEQQLLAESFDDFIRQIVGSGDYRISIISTDVYNACGNGEKDDGTGEQCDDGNLDNGDGCNEYCQTEPVAANTPPPGLISGREQNGTRFAERRQTFPFARTGTRQSAENPCVDTDVFHGCFRGADSAIITSSMTPENQINEFSANVALGSCGYGVESGMSALMLALESTKPGRCNEGFLRPEANLVIIFVSDEDDQIPRVSTSSVVEAIKKYKDIEKVRVGVIAGVNAAGDGADCRVGGDTCGSLCAMRPPEGSLTPCNDSNECIDSEYCDSAMDVCKNQDLQYFDNRDIGGKFCSWCSWYKVDDCCSARAGHRYVDVARAIEAEVTRIDSNVTATMCRRSPGERVACLIDSICQENFSQTLKSIARDLVSTDRYTLDPPACNPEGVTVVVGGKKLKYLEEFEILNDGKELYLTGVKPGPEDDVEIFFVVDGCGE